MKVFERLGSLLEEKRDQSSRVRWSMSRLIILALVVTEIIRLLRMDSNVLLNMPEAVFASVLAFALPVAWLMYSLKGSDIPKVLESFFGMVGKGGGAVFGDYGGPTPGHEVPSETDADGEVWEEGEE